MSAESQYWDGKQLAVYLVAFVLAIGPFFNGMFFEPIRLVGVALACVAYWLWYTGKRETSLAWNGIDWSVLAWFLSYVLASINPVLPRGHLSVMLDMVAFLAVYTVIRFSPGLERSVGRILIGSGVVMMTISVARFGGVTWFDRHVVDLVINNRLSGGFQYANTFAVWLCCLVLLTLREARTPRLGSLFLLLGGLFAGTFMLTLSRGALVAAPAAYLVVMLLGTRENRPFTAWAGVLTWGPAFVLGSGALRALQQEHRAVGLLMLSACALPPLATPLLAKFTESVWNRKRPWGIAIGVVLLLAALAAAPMLTRIVRPVLGKVTDNRITSGFEMSDLSIFSRLIFDRDAWRIMLQQHFLGGGGRAWTKLYLQVRSYPYFTTEVHNHFLQTGVEAGIIGLLAFVAMLALCLIVAWRSRRADPSVAIWAGVAIYVGVHSAFDFDLSYISLLLLLAVAVGVISSRNTVESGDGHNWIQLWRHSLAAVTILALIAAGSLYVSKRALQASDQAWDRGDIPHTISNLQLAHRTDPLNAELLLRMAALKSATDASGTSLPDEKTLLTQAQALDAHSAPATLDLAGMALQQKRWTEAFDLASVADSFVPLDQGLNGAVASTMWEAASGALKDAQTQTAHSLAIRLKDYGQDLDRRFTRTMTPAGYDLVAWGHNGMSHLRIGQGLILTGDYAAAADHLREAAKSQGEKAEAEQWLFVALNLDGKKQDADELRQANGAPLMQFLRSDLYGAVMAAAEGR